MDAYDRIGKGYRATRRADPRITKTIIGALGVDPPATVVDVGAGTGNYSRAVADTGYQVIAIEPSDVMRQQAPLHERVTWQAGYAEAIPLDNESADAVMCTLALHHFQDQDEGLREMKRLLRPGGSLALFTQDVRLVAADAWLLEYFAPLIVKDYERFPPMDRLVRTVSGVFGSEAQAWPFPLPHDLVDGFFAAAWRHPERYLDAAFRAGISVFSQSTPERVGACVKRLKTALESGEWDCLYGEQRRQEQYDYGYRMVAVARDQG